MLVQMEMKGEELENLAEEIEHLQQRMDSWTQHNKHMREEFPESFRRKKQRGRWVYDCMLVLGLDNSIAQLARFRNSTGRFG